MKKCLSVIILLMVVFVSNGFSASLGTWQGAAAGDANHAAGTGSWSDAYWKPTGKLPAPPSTSDLEIKIAKAKTVCTADSNIGNYACRISITGGADLTTAPKLEIVKGANIGSPEIRVGAGGASATGGFGRLVQTGGTLNVDGKLLIGRYGTSSNNPNDAKGFYKISGGTITCLTGEGLLCLGAAGPSEGTLTIVGKGANINVKKLFIGSDGKKNLSSGILEFKIDANGVSPIKVADAVTIDPFATTSTAKLIVSAVAAPPKTDILLVETIGGGQVTGIFDTVNEKPATEGAEVIVNNAGNNYYYKLTYKGGTGANDIVLKFDHTAPGAAPAAPAAAPAKPAAPTAPAAPAAPAKPVAPAAPAAPVAPVK